MSDVAREIALLREEVKEYTHAILTLVIGGNTSTVTPEEVTDFATRLVDASQAQAQRIVDRRHG